MRTVIQLLVPALLCSAADYFRITAVDAETGRGVPLVEISAGNEVAFWTDSNGIAAIDEPGFAGHRVRFGVRSHGYVLESGNGGSLDLLITAGGSAVIRLHRTNIAERLYRVTGEGIYRDSLLTGEPVPLRHASLNAKVTGQDSVTTAVYQNKIFWVWGDTNGIGGELSLACSGATSDLAGVDPARGIDLSYFLSPSGFAKSVCNVPGPGMKWNFWVAALPDDNGKERLLLRYRRMKDLGKPVESGLLLWNHETETFEPLVKFSRDFDSQISIHPFRAVEGTREYLYLADPYPSVRMQPSVKTASDPAQWQVFTCLKAGTRFAGKNSMLDRSAEGRLVYGWKRNTDSVGFDRQKELVDARLMKLDEGWFQLRDVITDARIKPHAGSVAWNGYRQRWVFILQEERGLADNGEIWFAEADTPVGPWVYARRIVTHDKYTLYNPVHHPFFDQNGGRLIYFEGTYSDMFSSAKRKTPRYDYNQLMYRLALDDPRLVLPVPVYRMNDGRYLLRPAVDKAALWEQVADIPFFALPPGAAAEDAGVFPNFAGMAPSPKPSVAGEWTCTATQVNDPDEKTIFRITLQQAGERVSGESASFQVSNGAFAKGTLTLTLADDGGRYSVAGQVRGAAMHGSWKSVANGGGGPVDCTRAVGVADNSPALVPLYVYPGPRYELKPRSPGDRPTARVWRNPHANVIVDSHVAPSR